MISGHVLLLEYTILLRLAARQPQAHTVFHATPHAITTCCAISTYGCDGVPCGLASSDGIISRLPQATECHVASLPPRPAPRSAPQSLLGYGARRACQLTLCQPLLAASRFCARDVLLDVFRQRRLKHLEPADLRIGSASITGARRDPTIHFFRRLRRAKAITRRGSRICFAL